MTIIIVFKAYNFYDCLSCTNLKKEKKFKKEDLLKKCLIKTNTYVKLKACDNLKIFD